MSSRRSIALGGALALLVATHANCPAQSATTRPDRVVDLVVPFAPGGGTDFVARLIGERLGQALGQPVVITYRPGANGAVAGRNVLAQPADGYTLLFGSYSTQVIAPLLTSAKDKRAAPVTSAFAAVSLIAHVPLVLAVNADAHLRTLNEFLAGARSRPTTFGTFGMGSSAHVFGEWLASAAHVQLTHVPYKGSAPATTDLLGNQLDSVLLTVPAVAPLVNAGRLRALAVSSSAGVPALPGVPTFSQAGFEGPSSPGWFAVFVASKTPGQRVAELSAALGQIVAQPDVRAQLVAQGLEPVGSTSAEAQAIWRKSTDSARAILAKTKIELE